MKIRLEFNDDEPQMAMRAIYSSIAFCALWDMDSTLRNFLKHGDDRFKTAQDLATHLREEIAEVLAKVEE